MRLKVGLLGGGSWGTTVAAVVSRNAPITLWARDAETVEGITADEVLTDNPLAALQGALLELDQILARATDDKTLIATVIACAEALAKYRINPGNVGFGKKKDTQFAQLIEFAIQYDKPVRIGANWGSLDQALAAQLMDENHTRAEPWDAGRVMREALIRSALDSAHRAVALGLAAERIVLSAKVSGVQELVAVYRDLAARSDFALHLGLTEAGIGSKGIVASSAALGVLLQEGIGDTIRISLTPEPGASRTQEVIVAQELLQTMGLRAFTPMVTACPGCGRTTSEFFQELAKVVQEHVRGKMPEWKVTRPGAENMTLAVMGCVVNGPGESRHANIGISLPGTGEAPSAPVFVDGEKTVTLRGENIATEFVALIDAYVERKYGAHAAA